MLGHKFNYLWADMKSLGRAFLALRKEVLHYINKTANRLRNLPTREFSVIV